MTKETAADIVIKAIETGETVTVYDSASIGTQMDHEITPEEAKQAIHDKLDDYTANAVATLWGSEVED